MVQSFRDLDVYKKAYTIALDVHEASLTLPQIEQFALSSQIRRSSKSICANIAEGFAKHYQSVSEFKRFLSIAMGSSDEMLVWADFCRDLGYIDDNKGTLWNRSYTEISKMLYSLSKNWKQ